MTAQRDSAQIGGGIDVTPLIQQSASGAVTMTVHVPVSFRQRSGRKALVSAGGTAVTPTSASRSTYYPAAVKALARAFRWRKLIESGVHATIDEIASTEGINPSYVSRVLRLTLVSPAMVERALAAETIPAWTSFMKPFPNDWAEQARLLSPT